MLLTITTTYRPATDLAYLLHKSPFRCQAVPMPFGMVNLFFPEATEEKCTVAVLLDVDPVELVRSSHGQGSTMPLEQYVNDRPYVCSSFMSVVLVRVFSRALSGKCKARPELVETRMPLTCRISVWPCRGGEAFLRRLFEPLGYSVSASRKILDEAFPEYVKVIEQLQQGRFLIDFRPCSSCSHPTPKELFESALENGVGTMEGS